MGYEILLVVQLYFFVYLKQLSGKLAPEDAAWDVPWIAMDMSRLSRILFFVSVVLVPSVAVALLSWHAATATSTALAHHWVIAKMISLVAAFLLVAILGILSWKYRPRVSMSINELSPPKQDA